MKSFNRQSSDGKEKSDGGMVIIVVRFMSSRLF